MTHACESALAEKSLLIPSNGVGVFRRGRHRIEDAAERAAQLARRAVALPRDAVTVSREKYERGMAYLDEAITDPVIKFHGYSDHDDFVNWIDEHPYGYVINRASDMLHNADCSAFVMHDPSYRLTTSMKICSLSRDRLEHWAEWRFWVHLQYCSRCRP